MMIKPTLIIVTTLLVASILSKTLVHVRAPAPVTLGLCDCQCDGTTYLDGDDKVQGNCRSADTTWRKWCYISQDNLTMSACKDTFGHDDRYNMSKSYAACSSPPIDSEQCAELILWRGDMGSSGHPPKVVDVSIHARTNESTNE